MGSLQSGSILKVGSYWRDCISRLGWIRSRWQTVDESQKISYYLNTEDRLLMKRKDRNLAEKQHESCGVWLDTSALKRRKLQNLIGKPALRILNRLPSYSSPSKAPLPCTKQTTISTFFRAQQSGERETNTNNQLLAVASNSASNLKDHERPISLTQPVVMQEWKQLVEKPQHISPLNSIPTESQRNSCVVNCTKGTDSAAQGEDPLSLNSGQHQEERGLLAQKAMSKSSLREKNGEWITEKPTPLASHSSPNLKVVSDKRTKGWRRYKPPSFCSNGCFVESFDSENINPELRESVTEMRSMKNFSKSPPGFCLKTNDDICNGDDGCETSQGDATHSLFTEDSDGRKVISHRFFCEQAKPSFPKKPQQGKSSSGVSASHKDCFGACYSVGRRRPISPGRSLSVLADISQESCYDLLFTEDSEGNKVIKH